jgi:serine protease Do
MRVITCYFLLLLSALSARAEGPRSVADLSEKLLASVVNISTTKEIKGVSGVPLPEIPEGSPFEEFFNDLLGDGEEEPEINSLGSGFVVDAGGLIVTNSHVIKDADDIIVNFSDGSKLQAKLVGNDSKTDMALLRVTPKRPLKAIRFGNSETARIGDWVMAIGNPFGLGGTVTVGIISAKKRNINSGPYDNFIQTDASINRGNSGGPLFNMHGEVIGVNTAIISPNGGSIGIGFALPSSTAMRVIEQLVRYGEVKRAWLGVRGQAITDAIAENLGLANTKGALITNVVPKSPADTAGIITGDIILEFDGISINEARMLPRMVAETSIGKTLRLKIFRKGELKILQVKLQRLVEKESTEELPPTDNGIQGKSEQLLGITLHKLDDKVREFFGIGSQHKKGVVVTSVKPKGNAEKNNIRPGNIIIEVDQREVMLPADVFRLVTIALRKKNRTILLLLADEVANLRFVALPIK